MQPSNRSAQHPPRALDPDAVRAALGAFGLQPAQVGEIVEVRDWAAGLIGPAIASSGTVFRVHRRMGEAALFVRREPDDPAVTGMLAWIALTEAGVRAVLNGAFSGRDPAHDHVAAPGEAVAGCYGWGMAASCKTASRAVLGATASLNFELFAHAPFFTRAATPDGRRVIVERFHYEPAPGADPDLFWRPIGQGRAA